VLNSQDVCGGFHLKSLAQPAKNNAAAEIVGKRTATVESDIEWQHGTTLRTCTNALLYSILQHSLVSEMAFHLYILFGSILFFMCFHYY
jgi:hypothetical protein